MLYSRSGEQHLISELSGWGHRFPLLAACLTICMLSLAGIPPTVGEDRGEVAAAADGVLPDVVTALRGDLHGHSDWSGDGRASIEEMAAAAAAWGL